MMDLFALGSNGSGQLGIGHKEDVSVPKPVQFSPDPPGTVTAVAAGGNHTLLLTGSGELYWSGDAASGACGRVPGAAEPIFRAMASPDGTGGVTRVGMVAATWEASVFTTLDQHGKNTALYSCGVGLKGELGQGPLIVRVPAPSRIPDFIPPDTEVVHLSACMGHAVVVLSNGHAYGWGNGRKGQLGGPEELVFSPRKIEGVPFSITKAACGKDFTCFVGEASKGQICILGSDKWGLRSSAPPAVPGWQEIGAGWSNIYVLLSDGRVLSWGRNDYGQNTPDIPLKALKIAIGSEHAVALLEGGDVLAWGWGEHGNCGPAPTQQQPTGGQHNMIASSKYLPPGTRITGIGAGCATSWVIIEQQGHGSS